jgi:hypothetical protein
MMRSKWLNWQPGDVIMEKTTRALPTKPTKPGFVGFGGTTRRGIAITRDGSRPHVGRVLAVINELVDPPGFADWLRVERPQLLAHGRELIAAIDRALTLPDATELEGALARLKAFYEECCRLFEAHLQNAAEGILERPRAQDEGERAQYPSFPAMVHEEQQAQVQGCHGTDKCIAHAATEQQRQG